jgi:endoglucanase
MTRGRFQGSNKPDFSDAVDLFTVTGIPKAGSLTTVNVRTTAHFRYLRYLSPHGGSANVAEIVFLGSP